MFQDFSSHISKFLSSAKLVNLQNSRKKLSIARHRLDDNFHWRCSSCHSIVPTHETRVHLNSCSNNTSPLETGNLSSLSDPELDHKKLLCFEIKPMDRHQRPRTKKLERPTPNLKHPIIKDNKSKESKQFLKDKFFSKKNSEKSSISSEIIVKTQSISLEKGINKTEANIKDKGIHEKSSSPCKTCNREIAPEKFHCHNGIASNKPSLLKRNKTEEKCVTSSNDKHIIENQCKANPIITNKNNFYSKSTYSIAKYKAKNELKMLDEESRCRICNNSYEMIRLSAHEKLCAKDKIIDSITKDENDRKNGQSINKDGCDPAGWEHFKSQLIPCSRCLRTFFPHRLPIHEKSCRGIPIKQTTKPNQESKVHMKANIPTKSVFLDCTTCGRKYSTTSLTLHELKCRSNVNCRKLSIGKFDNANEINIAWEHFKTQLVPCNKCKRKFLPDRLEKHEPICKANPIINASNH